MDTPAKSIITMPTGPFIDLIYSAAFPLTFCALAR